jgi:NAD(P)-dependent dehydrogenase (short-subunit alcohol dehydrogenase family)
MSGARYPDLEGRGVLVTGGASGIGAAIVAAFVQQGARRSCHPAARSPCS